MHVERDVVLNKLTLEENTVLYVLRDTLNGTQGEKLEIDANVNWDSIYRILVQQSLFHIGYNSLKAFLPQSVYSKWYATHFLLKNRIRRDINETCEVIGKIGNLSSHIAIAKGFVLSQQIYGDLYMRQYSDVDIYSDREWIHAIVNKTTRRKINRIRLSSGHLQWERKERNISASILYPENIRFSIQIQQDEIFEQRGEKELLLELYECWETTKSPFNAWVTVGWDCKPKELVIDAGL